MSNYPPGYSEPESLDSYLERLEDGEPCHHPGCLRHVSHPCEGCGRIAGRAPEVVAPIGGVVNLKGK